MKYLIAISSCWDYEKNGNNAAQRATWLPDVANFPGLDYKFFFGTGQGAEKLVVNVSENVIAVEFADRDYIILPQVPDDQRHLTYKTQASLYWARQHDYDFVLRAFPDTYIRVDRLMACAFRDFDFYGDFRGALAWPGYASGGACYSLSQPAYQRLVSAPILGVGRDHVFNRVEDMWVGWSLTDVKRFDDQRFKNTRNHLPAKDNDFVTAHLSYIERDGRLKAEPYKSEYMYAAHEAWQRS